MLRITMSLTLLALVSLTICRMSCFGENERSLRTNAGNATEAIVLAEFGEEPALTEPVADSIGSAEKVEAIFSKNVIHAEEFNPFGISTAEPEHFLSAPVISTPLTQESPFGNVANSETAVVRPAVTTEQEIAWQAGDPFFSEPPVTEAPSLPGPPISAEPTPSFEDIPADIPAESADEDEAQWHPTLSVIVNQPADTAPNSAIKAHSVKIQAQVMEPFSTFSNGRQVTQYRAEHRDVETLVANIAGGVTVIRCDEIDARISHAGDNAGAYEFEINSKLELRNASVTIEAGSAELKEGQLTLKDVTLKSPHTTLKSAEVTLELNVKSLRVGEPIKLPSPQPASSVPGAIYQPASFDRNSKPKGEIRFR